MYLEEIRGAVGRGWCHPKNKHKTMDIDLAEAITIELVQLWQQHGTETPQQEVDRLSEELTRNHKKLHGTEKEQPDADRRAKVINHAVEDAREPSKPTRKEWEEWAEKKPHPFRYRTTPDNQIDFAAWHYATMYWFLTMPGVPKE